MTDEHTTNSVADLMRSETTVINIGLSFFADDLRQQGVTVVDVDWTPPAGGDPKLADLLSKLGA